jgi:serine phosphatase RsbU (regulator of sigma subunit)
MRLSLKLLLIFELVLLVGVVALVVPVWSAMRDQVIEDMQNELKAIAATAALAIDGDLHEQIRDSADADSEAFRQLRELLARFQEANHVAFDHIYTFYREGDRVRFAVMLHPEPFTGDPYTLQPLMKPVFEPGTVEATELYEDQHGHWISAYAPIRDSSGAVVGLLEVDKDSRMYMAKFREVTRLTLAVGLVALVISSIVGWIVLQWIVIRPMNAVHGGMMALSRQDFRQRVLLQTGDEFEELGRTFNDMAEQLNVASRVQSGLFPATLPEHPGYRIAACSAPCEATGGDYYDAFTLEDGRIVILVADVSGHGLGPSLLMASCRSALRVLSGEGLSPREILEKLDARMSQDLPEGRFITMILGLLDSDGVLTFSNAGHGPAMVVANGEVRQLGPHMPPIGLGFLGESGQSAVHLAADDRVFFASDGVSEATSPDDDEFGVERICRIVGDRSITSHGVLERLNQALAEHSRGAPRTDDVTMLCVDRLQG